MEEDRSHKVTDGSFPQHDDFIHKVEWPTIMMMMTMGKERPVTHGIYNLHLILMMCVFHWIHDSDDCPRINLLNDNRLKE